MANISINVRPTVKQQIAWEELLENDVARFILFGGGVSCGKSFMGCEWLLVMCLSYPGTKYFIARNELKRILSSTYLTMLKVLKHHGLPADTIKMNGQYHFLEFANGSRIDLIDVAYQPRDPLFERFGSQEFTSGFLEEAGEIDHGAFKVLRTRIGRHRNQEYNIMPKIFITANPKKNWLYSLFYKGKRDGTLEPDHKFIQALAIDNIHNDPEYIKSLLNSPEGPEKERLVRGSWDYDDSANKIFDYQRLLNMFKNDEPLYDSEWYITCDVARLGQDRTVIYVWKGWTIVKALSYGKQTLDATLEVIEDMRTIYNIEKQNVVVDEDGVGGGLVDFSNGYQGFVNNSKAKEGANYVNLKSQCYFEIAKMVNLGQLSVEINDDTIKDGIIADLEAISDWNSDQDSQKLRVIPKSELKKLIGRSSDYGDAFCMRFFFELCARFNVLPIKGLM